MPSRAPVELDFLGLRPAATAADDDERLHGSTGTAAASSIRGRSLLLPRRKRLLACC
jgi:jasmonate ZIM domain-containing protein